MVQISARPKVTIAQTSRLFIGILYIAAVVIVRTINSRPKRKKKIRFIVRTRNSQYKQTSKKKNFFFVREFIVLTMTTAATYSMSINSLDVSQGVTFGSDRDLNH